MFHSKCEHCGITLDQMRAKYQTQHVALFTSHKTDRVLCPDCMQSENPDWNHVGVGSLLKATRKSRKSR